MNRAIALLVLAGVALVTLLSSLFTVHQTQQVLITQFGEPVRVIREPGLHAKLPFIQSVITFDRRLLDLASPGDEVILGDQRRLIVDSFTRFRITDPLEFFQTVRGTEVNFSTTLRSIVSSALRRVLGTEPLFAVLSQDRGRIMNQIRHHVNEEARRFGVEVEDVRIRRADLPEENTQAILARMQTERQRVASEQRAEGQGEALRIRANADRERTVLLAEARAQADILRGQGEQEAIRIFAEAFQRDPAFFQFWRTMQAYREALGEGGTRLVLTPDSEFFRFFRESPAGPLTAPVVAAQPPAGAAAAAQPGAAARPAAAALPAPAAGGAAPPAGAMGVAGAQGPTADAPAAALPAPAAQ
ncbi:protein HflC [Caldovatus sediminis]|uniref:Protein HflC n=1 Tax=Caldovatus sediminis TaxID=2041189 RepID=A0A8J3EAP5_9PROT|nr:protease modulator HflC [Caldovatus sediminis]GGG17502.1 protein HflC [Caldovatus sediminis]